MSIAAYILTFALAQGFDTTTTVIGLQRGCRELVYSTQNPAIIAGIKAVGVTTFSFTFPIAHKQRGWRDKLWKGIWAAGVTSGIAGGVWNMTQINKCGR